MEHPYAVLLERVKRVIEEQLELAAKDVTLASSLADDLGLRYRDAVQFIMALEEEFDVDIPDEAFDEMNTVRDVVTYIEEQTV